MSRQKNKPADTGQSRRRLVKTVAMGGSALGLASLPGKWAKPTVASVILPAHAQTSTCVGTLANCPSGFHYSTGTATATVASVDFGTFSTQFPGVSITNGTLQGSGVSKYSSSVIGPCPSPCGSLEGRKYLRGSYSFGHGSLGYTVALGIHCGDEPIGRFSYEINLTYVSAIETTHEYTGTYAKYLEACKYLVGGSTMMRAPLSRPRRSPFAP